MKKFTVEELKVIKFAIEKEFEGFRRHSAMENETFNLFMEYQELEANPDLYDDGIREITYQALKDAIEDFEIYKKDGKDKAEKHIKEKQDKIQKDLEDKCRKHQEKMIAELDELIAKREEEADGE